MITATYSIDDANWTRVIDAALAEWGRYIHGDAEINFNISFVVSPGYLALAGPARMADAGALDGKHIQIPSAAYKILTGWHDGLPDIFIQINPNNDWYFGPNSSLPANKYSAISAMMHELGHGLFMGEFSGLESATPYQIGFQNNPLYYDGHSLNPDDLMYWRMDQGQVKSLTQDDLRVARQSGLPTEGDDRIFIPIEAVQADAGAGFDTAIWLGGFSEFATRLINFELLEMPNAALTPEQQELYLLYKTAFGRVPDLDGFKWWSQMDIDVASVAFVGSDEFRSLFDPNDRSNLIHGFYENAFDRQPDPSGWNYWNAHTEIGAADVLIGFALAEENSIANVSFFA